MVAPRVLVCIEDTGVAHVVAARLMKDGVDGVVVDKPNRLLEEAKKGVSALAVQDRYPSGEAATSLLRQIRLARQNEAVPAIVLLTGDMTTGDKLVLEKQYKVKEFIRIAENPIRIAQAVSAAAGKDDDDLILHPDEAKNAFDISIDSVAIEGGLDKAFDPEAFDGEDLELKTVEVSAQELAKLRHLPEAPATQTDAAHTQRDKREPPTGPGGAAPSRLAPVTQESKVDLGDLDKSEDELVLDNATSEGLYDLSQLPPPGGPDDVELGPATLQMPAATQANNQAPSPISALAPPASGGEPQKPVSSPASAKENVKSPRAPEADEGDAMQIQELQKTQNELKKALLAERKQREAAQKRVEELEAKLNKMADPSQKTMTAGVPNEGVFEDLRYPALLARCRAEAFTGAILMQSGGANRTVFLKDGLPVGFHSSEPGERIGKVLVNQGRITEDQYMKATTRSVERNIKLTDSLVELGLMDAETIAVELRNLTRDQIIQSFELVQGRFTVTAGQTPDANTATFDFGPGEIYVQGYRRYAPTNEMMAAYETLRDKYLIANARLASYRPKLGLNTEDERVLRLLGEALTVEEAVERAQVTPEQAARLLSALQALELVEEWSPGVEQFRSRIRAEKQRHAEEINAILVESRQREGRILEALEKITGRSLNVSLDEPVLKPQPSAAVARSSSPFSGGGLSAPAGSAAPSSSSSSPPSSASALATAPTPMPSRSPISSTTIGREERSERGPSINVSPSVSVSAQSAGASEPPSSVASSSSSASMGGGLGGGMASSRANGSSASPGITKASDSQQSLSLADVKYREGVEQAATNRLDEAEVTLREAVRLDASKPEYLTALARVLLANPRYERAGTLPVVRSLLDRAVQLAPDNTEAQELHQQVIKEMSN